MCLQSMMPTSSLTLCPVEPVFSILPYTSAIPAHILPPSKAASASASDGKIQESRECVLNLGHDYEPYWVHSAVLKDRLSLSCLMLTATL